MQLTPISELPPVPKLPTPAELMVALNAVQLVKENPDSPLRDLAIEVAESVLEPKERLVKLARSGMRSYAARLLRDQDGLCPLCKLPVDLRVKGEGVLDHDHDTGRIRGVLHRSCNAAEGKISNAAARWGAKSSQYAAIISYLENLVGYLKKPPTNLIYPMHKDADEKRDDRNRKAREQRATLAARRVLARQKRIGET